MESSTNSRDLNNKNLFVENVVYYHIQRTTPWKDLPWTVGQTYFIGSNKNPFIGFYDTRSFIIQDPISKKGYPLNYVAHQMIKYIDTKEKDKNLEPFYHFNSERSVKELNEALKRIPIYHTWVGIFKEMRLIAGPWYPFPLNRS